MTRRDFAHALLTAFLLACSSSTVSTPADGGAASDADAASDSSCKTTLAKSQTLSQPCCTGWGGDACGALLFCAAFDGRTQTTCYPEGVRRGGESCDADAWCASRECAPNGKCRFVLGETCDQTTGCVSVKSVPYGCAAGGTCKACDVAATDPRCPAICKGQDSGWTSSPCRICQSSACCTQLAACAADQDCVPHANTMLACGGTFQSCLNVSFDGQLDATSAALKQCFSGAVQSCAQVCP